MVQRHWQSLAPAAFQKWRKEASESKVETLLVRPGWLPSGSLVGTPMMGDGAV